MSLKKTLTYMQMVQMTESVLRDFHTWIYKQYRRHVTTLQICIIMLRWGVAQTADEAFFLTRWIQAFSELSWIQLRANLRSATMPPRLTGTLGDTPLMKLFLAFKVPLILWNATGQTQGQYTMKESRNLHLYLGTFQRDAVHQRGTGRVGEVDDPKG